MIVRQIHPEEWREYRAIRLAALAEAPDAFGSSLADEQVFPDERWQERAAGSTERMVFVAVGDNDEWIGLAGSYTPGDPPADAELVSMWVDPRTRGAGVGRALVDAVLAWATNKGFGTVGLWVTASNAAAITLYERCGFADNGEHQPLPSNPDLQEVRMLRRLTS